MSAEVVNLSEIIRRPDVMYVYNPADRDIEQDVGGCTLVFAKAEDDRFGHGAGVTPVKGMTWYYRVGRDQTLQVKANGGGAWDAGMVMEFLVGPDGRSGALGACGIRPLTGIAERDVLIKAEAKKAWSEKRYFDARSKVRSHEDAVETARKSGRERPAHSKAVEEAYRIVKEYEDGGYAPVARFICEVCNKGVYSEGEKQRHMEDAHYQTLPQTAAPVAASSDALVNVLAEIMKGQQAVVELLTKKAEPKKRGRPKKAEVAE